MNAKMATGVISISPYDQSRTILSKSAHDATFQIRLPYLSLVSFVFDILIKKWSNVPNIETRLFLHTSYTTWTKATATESDVTALEAFETAVETYALSYEIASLDDYKECAVCQQVVGGGGVSTVQCAGEFRCHFHPVCLGVRKSTCDACAHVSKMGNQG